jgi:hypothetical protein
VTFKMYLTRSLLSHNHYGDTIVIESQKGQGQSNIVFSSSISVADAIRAASKLKADLKFSEIEASFVDVNGVKLFLCNDISFRLQQYIS